MSVSSQIGELPLAQHAQRLKIPAVRVDMRYANSRHMRGILPADLPFFPAQFVSTCVCIGRRGSQPGT